MENKTITISKMTFPSVFLIITDYGFDIQFGGNVIPISKEEGKKLVVEINKHL